MPSPAYHCFIALTPPPSYPPHWYMLSGPPTFPAPPPPPPPQAASVPPKPARTTAPPVNRRNVRRVMTPSGCVGNCSVTCAPFAGPSHPQDWHAIIQLVRSHY